MMGEYAEQYDAWITVCRLPKRVKGLCRRCIDDNVILINEELCHAEQIKAARHEGKHLQRGDLDNEDAVEVIEK